MKIRLLVISMMFALLTFSMPNLYAKEALITLNKEETLTDFLNKRLNTRVALKLVSGEEVDGSLKMIGTHVLHLGGLTGREFYDAIIPIKSVVAVIVRNR